MKSYSDYLSFDAEAFLADPSFRAWIAASTPEMEAYWRGLLETHPHLEEPFAEAKWMARGLENTWIPFSQAYVDEQYKKTFNSLPTSSFATRRTRRFQFAWSYAAALLIPLLTSLLAYDYYFREKLVQTGNAELKTLTLYDGSEIRLNANSQLRLPSRYGWRSTREVWLEGEGSFAVQREADERTGGKRKFTVHTERAELAVLGTRFTVYNRSNHTRVLLEEGRIALTDPVSKKVFLMEPGQIASRADGDKGYKVEQVNIEQQQPITAWRSDLLVFQSTPLSELKKRFQEVYGIELVMEDEEINAQHFTGELPVSDTEKALTILSEAFDLEIVPYQERIYLISKP
jgi:transmembrane sensor